MVNYYMAKEEKAPKPSNDPFEKALAELDKNYGENTVAKLDSSATLNIEAVSSGCLSLDDALGIGGLPRGRIAEIYGPESVGKTTLAMHVVAEAMKIDPLTKKFIYVDAEHAVDPPYAAKIGVDLDRLYLAQPSNGEEALNTAIKLVRTGAVSVLVIDSVSALIPKKLLEGEIGDQVVGLQAKMMSQACPQLASAAEETDTIVIFINQLREKIGVTVGSPETTSGGRALKFYASVRIDMRRTESAKSGDEIVGNKIKATIRKNKVAAPFKVAYFDITFGKGIDKEKDIIDWAVDLGIVKKSGAWYSYGEHQLGQGMVNAAEFLEGNSLMFQDIYDRVLEGIKV